MADFREIWYRFNATRDHPTASFQMSTLSSANLPAMRTSEVALNLGN